MKIYIVGGAVRDALLGRPAGDRDYVVVGASPDEMTSAGFMPVGKDFPVFLHPETHEEYALARTERKVASGYHGFKFYTDPSVRLEDDLMRRDLTINAIAQDPITGELIDPCGGRADLQARVLRHVGAAFAEDPVRILRLARFAARFPEFIVAQETQAICKEMVNAGEANALVPERVWQELRRGLEEIKPSRMIDVLQTCGALACIAPGLSEMLSQGNRAVVFTALDTPQEDDISILRWAILTHQTVNAAHVSSELRAPNEYRDLARLVQSEHEQVAALTNICTPLSIDGAEKIVGCFDRCDAWRKPHRFSQVLQACKTLHPIHTETAWNRWREWLNLANGLDLGLTAQTAQSIGKQKISDAIRSARVNELVDRAR